MGFLNQLLKYKNICIQCHNSPDADALAGGIWGVYIFKTTRYQCVNYLQWRL